MIPRRASIDCRSNQTQRRIAVDFGLWRNGWTSKVPRPVKFLLILTLLILPSSRTDAQVVPDVPPFAVTVQLPTFGIAINADGVLRVATQSDATGQLLRNRLAAAAQGLPHDVQALSECRAISLRRLDAALAQQRARGAMPTDVMIHLAGLTRVRYVLLFPDQHDIVIAGPAGGWVEDGFGGAISLQSGQPVLQLADLVTALRATGPSQRRQHWVGCTIQPSADGLRRLQAFQASIPAAVASHQHEATAAHIRDGSLRTLGMAEIIVFGISNRTRMAQRIVAADYRMKRIAVAVDPPPVPRLKTFLGQLTSTRKSNLQRWWFTPKYEGVRVSEDRQSLELAGLGVQLSTEGYRLGSNGRLQREESRPSRASQTYARSFTELYDEIAQVEPVFADLRNAIDLLVAAAFIGQQDGFNRVEWEPTELLDEERLPVEVHPAPTHAPCVVNAIWKGSRLLAPVGGGVSIEPSRALEPDVVLVSDEPLASKLRASSEHLLQDKESWWWD